MKNIKCSSAIIRYVKHSGIGYDMLPIYLANLKMLIVSQFPGAEK